MLSADQYLGVRLNRKTYSTYLGWMLSSSEKLGETPDDLELVIFQDATKEFASKSKWRAL
jgi:hypothetical protein